MATFSVLVLFPLETELSVVLLVVPLDFLVTLFAISLFFSFSFSDVFDALETLEALLWFVYTLFLSPTFFSAGLFAFVLLFLFNNEIISGSLFCCDILLEDILFFIYSYPEVLT